MKNRNVGTNRGKRSGKSYSNCNGKKFDDKYEASESNSESGKRSMRDVQSNRNVKMTNKPGNDPNFYHGGNEDLLFGAFNINFSYPAGQANTVGVSGGVKFTGNVANVYQKAIPTLVTASIIPTFGRNVGQNDPLNITAQELYTNVRYANSGSRNYDTNDLALYLLGMADVYSYINYMVRLYAIMTSFTPMNRALPRALVEANYADYDDLLGRTAELRYGINLLIDKTSSLVAPDVLKLFERRASIYTQVFIESESVRDQMYMYVPEGFMKFALDSDGAGMLQFTPFGQNNGSLQPKYTLDQLLSFGNSLIDQYFRDEDSGIISGDLLKAYGDRVYGLAMIPERVPLNMTTDVNVLNQFKNALVLGCYDLENVNPFNVVQNSTKTFLTSTPIVSYTEILQNIDTVPGFDAALKLGFKKAIMASHGGLQLLSFPNQTPSQDDVVEATRLHYAYDTNTISTSVLLYTGSEICNRITVYKPNVTTNSNGPVNVPTMFVAAGNPGAQGNSMAYSQNEFINTVCNVSACKWCPAIHILYATAVTADAATITNTQNNDVMQVANFTYVDQSVLKRMHEAVLMNQLYVTGSARVK